MAKSEKPKIEWKNPPPAPRGTRHAHDALRAALRERAGEWAVVITTDHAQNATTRAYAARRAAVWRGFEIVARGREVYARFVGEVKP